METKELKIVAPNGYEIDKENSTLEKIVFKKIGNKPKSWEEYCDLQIINNKKGYYINDLTSKINEAHWDGCVNTDVWKDVLPSKDFAEAFLAMMQLMSIRQEWIGDWQPMWGVGSAYQYCIVVHNDKLDADFYTFCQHPLSFPTMEMANEFMACFRDLLEIAKPLI